MGESAPTDVGSGSRWGGAGFGVRRLLAIAPILALIVAACSNSGTAAVISGPTDTTLDQECALGLDLWDSDPALTWIQDGRIWVRTGDHQACLTITGAADLWWSPDGRRLFLDDDIIEGDTLLATPAVAGVRQVVWKQPFGESIYVVGHTGDITSNPLGFSDPGAPLLPAGVVAMASHPDGEHFATIDETGVVSLVSAGTDDSAAVLTLGPGDRPLQVEFSPDGSRLWLLVDDDQTSRAIYVDLLAVSSFLDIPPVESIVPVEEPLVPPPNLYYLDVDLTPGTLDLESGVGALSGNATGFVLHPAHSDWIVLSEGSCASATSSLFMDGVVAVDSIPGSAVGFFRGRGLPVLATTTSSAQCGQGQLWVVDNLPVTAAVTLVADGVLAADIRDEAPDPWNPNAAPPFA